MRRRLTLGVAALAAAAGGFFLAQGSAAGVNLSGWWVATITSNTGVTRVLRWDIVDSGGNLSGSGVDRTYTISGTGTAGGAVRLHFVHQDGHTNDFVGTVDSAGRTMTGTWVGSRGRSGTARAIRSGSGPPPTTSTIGSTTPLPPPKPSVNVNVKAGTGTTLVRLPGRKAFARLRGGAQIPVGAEVDTTRGSVGLTSAEGTVQFSKGKFLVREPKAAAAVRITDLVLTGGDFTKCPKTAKRATAGVVTTNEVRTLWGNGKGKFRTTGKYAAATVRGTKWRITDRCDGTLTRVLVGSVTVRDIKLKKSVVVTAGRTYLAKR